MTVATAESKRWALLGGPLATLVALGAAAGGLVIAYLVSAATGHRLEGGGIAGALFGLYLLGCGVVFLKGLIATPVGICRWLAFSRKLRQISWTDEDRWTWTAIDREGTRIVASLSKQQGHAHGTFTLPTGTRLMEHLKRSTTFKIARNPKDERIEDSTNQALHATSEPAPGAASSAREG